MQNEVIGKTGTVHQGMRNGRGMDMDMGTMKGVIGAVRGTGHAEKLAEDDSVVVQYVVSLL